MPPAETSRQLKGLPICAGTNNGGSGGVPSEPENLPCPRCESTNTKFCYYNNYNLSQPRYFCKSCRRYWTRGGSLRNIPVGGGTRKKHSSSSSSSSSSKRARSNNSGISEQPTPEQQYHREREEEEKDKKAAILTTTIPCGELVPQQHSTVTTTTTSRMYGNMTAVPFPVVVKSERVSSPLMMNLNETASTTTSGAVTMPPVSFTSLLGGGGMFHPQHQEGFGGFLGLSGWGLGLNGSSSSGLGFDGLGFGIGGPVGKEEWGDVLGVGGGGGEIECKGEEEINNGVVCDGGGGGGGGGSSGGSSSGCNTWQLGGGSGVDDCGGLNGEDCFGWSDLAISTPGTGLE